MKDMKEMKEALTWRPANAFGKRFSMSFMSFMVQALPLPACPHEP
jgi:hypothetical protein